MATIMKISPRDRFAYPRKLIYPSQGWYWTKEWQEAEADVDEEIKKDQLSPKFETAGEGLK